MNKFILTFAILAASVANAEPVRVIVDFKDDVEFGTIQDVEKDLNINLSQNSKEFVKTKITTVSVEAGLATELIKRLSDESGVENVELSQTYSVLGGADFSTPDDKYYNKQKWHFDMIGLEKAWKVSTGKKAIVAILDTGISDGEDSEHPRIGDLEDTCILPGYNFIDDDENPYDVQSHGTHVGSSVAESTNNKIGGVGIAFDACLLPVKVLSDWGIGSTEGIAEGIYWATDNGAHIINMSLGGGGYSKILHDAIKYAVKHNVLVFCAAGNGGRPQIEYPAAMDGCLAISAVGQDQLLAGYSSYGDGGEGVFLAAPGGNKEKFGEAGGVWQSTVNPKNHEEWGMFSYNGTSMATPIAAGSAALVVSALIERDGKYKRSDVINILKNNATDKDDNFRYGAGIVNAGEAVSNLDTSGNSLKYVGLISLAIVAFLIVRKRKK